MKIKKRKKSSRIRGRRTIGRGSRKKGRGKGHRGGKGMAGTGKRAGQKLTLIQKYYKGKYLGKRGFKSHKKLKRVKKKFITIESLVYKFNNFKDKVVNLSNYRILGSKNIPKEIEMLKNKEIVCDSVTNKAKEILERAGIKIVINNNK